MLEYRFYSLQNQTNITIILLEDTYEEERGNDEYKIWNSNEMWGNEEEVRCSTKQAPSGIQQKVTVTYIS